MKLASLMDRTRDGELVVVSRDLTRYVSARPIASTLQAALDDWEYAAPRLQMLAEQLELGAVPWSRFHEHDAMSPLPRAYQMANGSAYLNHVELLRKARGAEMPTGCGTDPLVYQRSSDGFTGPRQPIVCASEAFGIDFAGEIAVIVGDVAIGATPAEAANAIRLVMLVNDISLRNLISDELAKGFGFMQSKPAASCSPVAVTPDELQHAWDGGKISLPLRISLNGRPFGKLQPDRDMCFDFPTLIAHIAKTRSIAAGSIIGSGTVSNKGVDGAPGKAIADGGAGYACLAEPRAAETVQKGAPTTSYLRYGDTVRIEMSDIHGHSVFGAIEQSVAS